MTGATGAIMSEPVILFRSQNFLMKVWQIRYEYDKYMTYRVLDLGWLEVIHPINDQIREDTR